MMDKFMALIVKMVLQVYTYFKLIKLFILNMHSFLYIDHTQ